MLYVVVVESLSVDAECCARLAREGTLADIAATITIPTILSTVCLLWSLLIALSFSFFFLNFILPSSHANTSLNECITHCSSVHQHSHLFYIQVFQPQFHPAAILTYETDTFIHTFIHVYSRAIVVIPTHKDISYNIHIYINHIALILCFRLTRFIRLG